MLAKMPNQDASVRIEAYVIAIQGNHGADLTTGDCLYFDYREAEAVLKERRKEGGFDYLKIFSLRPGPTVEDYQGYAQARLARKGAV
jgi:hypothetical protein